MHCPLTNQGPYTCPSPCPTGNGAPAPTVTPPGARPERIIHTCSHCELLVHFTPTPSQRPSTGLSDQPTAPRAERFEADKRTMAALSNVEMD